MSENTGNFFDNNEVVSSINENVIYIFGDTETTGLSAENNRMTEIALIKTDSNFNVIDTFEMFINPEQEISAKITELTGITESMVEDQPVYTEAIPTINSWWFEGTEGKRIIFVAHNAPFDNKFINAAFQTVLKKDIVIDFIDTVSLAREIYPFWKNHKLETCADKFDVVNENHHRAMNDTKVLYEIGKRLITEALDENMFDPVNFVTRKKLHYKQ